MRADRRAERSKRKRKARATRLSEAPEREKQTQKTQSERLVKQRRVELKRGLGTSENPIDVEVDENEQPQGRQTPLEQQQERTKAEEQAKMEALESDDYFEVLGLARGCSEADVKRAYRKLAVQWHPDKNRSHPKAEEYFKKIGEAYAVLSDPEKRAKYEAYGKAGLDPSGAAEYDDGAYHDGYGFAGHSGFSARQARDIFEAFFGGSDPFAELFGGFGGNQSGSQRRRTASSRQQRGGFGFGMMDDDMGFGSPMFGSPMGFGGGGIATMMDSFFGNGFGGGFGGDGFMTSTSFSSFGGGGGGGSFSSSSVSSSSFTDQNGHVVTKKTITTTDASGRTETKTEEYRNGKLVNSTSSAAPSRLAGAGRMQLESSTAAETSGLPGSASVARDQSLRRQGSGSRGSSRSRPRY